jgi:hypothetical protein
MYPCFKKAAKIKENGTVPKYAMDDWRYLTIMGTSLLWHKKRPANAGLNNIMETN